MKKITTKLSNLHKLFYVDEYEQEFILNEDIFIESLNGEYVKINALVKKITPMLNVEVENILEPYICAEKHLIMSPSGWDFMDNCLDLIDSEGDTLKIISKNKIGMQDSFDVSLDYPHVYCTANGLVHHNTMIPIYLGLKDMLENGTYDKIVLIRNNESTKDCGFLPGDIKQKFEVFERAFKGQINFLFNRDDAWEILQKKDILVFENTSFLRGITYSNCLIIADECQNYSMQEFSTIITRLDSTSKIVFCGDYAQTDLNLKKESSGFKDFLSITKLMEEFSSVEFTVEDIVRSDMIKSFILAKIKLGLI